MATILVSPPSTKMKSEAVTKGVDDIMLGSLAINKEPTRTKTLMCWLPENIQELVQETGKDIGNSWD